MLNSDANLKVGRAAATEGTVGAGGVGTAVGMLLDPFLFHHGYPYGTAAILSGPLLVGARFLWNVYGVGVKERSRRKSLAKRMQGKIEELRARGLYGPELAGLESALNRLEILETDANLETALGAYDAAVLLVENSAREATKQLGAGTHPALGAG